MSGKCLAPEELDRLIPSLCTRCGKCCLEWGGSLQASLEDVISWEVAGRNDILAYVDSLTEGTHDLWIKLNGDECRRCPFLRKDGRKPTYTCRIYDARPEVCREYPRDYDHMVLIGCEIVDELRKRGIDATGWVAA
jgi:Fe-S-cluster containining protein